ncbi:hypothetical protein E2C01_011115 [Portunus trituberculatus]|uniref:Uncharacterized protein n=1 Tax=Portunus trituberculatus TaxID=210409 RepID=A0A5B7DAV9_PORTR|nr:hypothetical protein [Portunus trituberculatus]
MAYRIRNGLIRFLQFSRHAIERRPYPIHTSTSKGEVVAKQGIISIHEGQPAGTSQPYVTVLRLCRFVNSPQLG